MVRLIVWFSGFMKPLSRLGLCRYDEWHRGQRLKLLLVGYNGARNTGADARVVALVKQLEEVLGADNVEMTVMTLDEKDTKDYFPNHVRQFHFTTVFFLSLLRATSRNHAAILCEGSTLTTTFAKALSVFYCEVLLSAKSRKNINHVSAVPINRRCVLIFEKVSPFNQITSAQEVMFSSLPIASASLSPALQRMNRG